MYAVIAFNLFGVTFKQRTVIALTVLVNLLTGFPKAFDFYNRWGMDYTAYIQQAGAFYNGERDYSRISGQIGPCYYPAGHLYHFAIAYWIHLQTEYGETIVKLLFYCFFTISQVYIVKICYLYWGTRK
jgi:hypothetical protein